MTDTQVKTTHFAIGGMHCANCEVLVERRLKEVPGIVGVVANNGKGQAEIHYLGELEIAALQKAVADDGYTVAPWEDGSAHGRAKNTPREYAEIGAIFLILIGLVFALGHFDLLPRGLSVSDNMSYGVVFLVGLVASVSSCIAVTGGLLVALAAKYNEETGARPGMQRFKPLIYFNAGRIISYTLLGGFMGALGSAITLSDHANGILTLAASAIMILLGLHMLKLFPSFGRVLPGMPKFFGHKVHDLAARDTKGSAFILGGATFFLPCGFTQALQLYVLAKGSFAVGALTMLAFALGTLPALISLSAVSSFARGAFQKHFLKFAGAAVILLGLMNIQYGFVLTGSEFASAGPAVTTGPASPVATSASPAPAQTAPAQQAEALEKQTAVMRVVGLDYTPNRFTVKQGVPVEWRIDASEAAGCGRMLLAPRLGIRKLLSANSTTTINFTPTETGDFAFNCGMGMMTPGSKFTVVAAGKG